MKTPHKITKELAFQIIKMHQNGDDTRDIAKFAKTSQPWVSQFVRAFNGNLKSLDRQSKETSDIIKSISPFYSHNSNFSVLPQNEKHNIDSCECRHEIEYECKIFFGLITLRFKPKQTEARLF